MTVGLACAIVLVTGAPQDEVIKWAGFRALDVALGAGIAIVASLLILRVKPRPAAHLRGLPVRWNEARRRPEGWWKAIRPGPRWVRMSPGRG